MKLTVQYRCPICRWRSDTFRSATIPHAPACRGKMVAFLEWPIDSNPDAVRAALNAHLHPQLRLWDGVAYA